MARAPAHIRRRGDSWNVVIRVDGERHEFGPRGVPLLGSGASREEVETWAREKHDRLRAQAKREAKRKALGLPGAVRFSELCEEFEASEFPDLAPGSRRSYRNTFSTARLYFDGLGDPLVDEVSRAHLKRFVSWRRTHRAGKAGKRVSGHTVAKDLRVLHRLFNFAIDLEYLEANPAARVKAPKPDPREYVILTGPEYDRLLAEAVKQGPMVGLYALLLGETGMRSSSEAARLQWPDVHLDDGFIWVTSRGKGHRTKTGRGRWVPMTPRLREAMREHFATYRMAAYGEPPRRSKWVFHHTENGRRKTAGARKRDLRTGFEKAVSDAKLPAGFRRHDLRHRRITTWLAEGKDVVKVKEAVGHASLQTTMGYTHLAKEHLRSLVEEPEGKGEAKQA